MCNCAQVFVKRSPTLGTLVSTKTRCIKLIFIGKITLVPVAFLMALSILVHLYRYVHVSNIRAKDMSQCIAYCVAEFETSQSHILAGFIYTANSVK